MRKSKRNISDKVRKISEGVLSRLVDLVLVSVYFGFEASLGGYTNIGFAGERAIDNLAGIEYESIKTSIRYLTQKGLIQATKEKILLSKITKEGKKRLRLVLPCYDDKRIWDGRIYIVTYDIPRENNLQRDLLRNYLKKIRCGSLQYSVWLTPYNPKKLIEEFIERRSIDDGLILVSSLGRDGTIGEMSLKELMERVYKLTDLNERYIEFISKVNTKALFTKDEVVFSFLSILKDDPQIPFELLPDDWVGDKAFELYNRIVCGKKAF